MKRIISVCGSDGSDEDLSSYALQTAEQIGMLIAQHDAVVVCGGRGGIMEATCKGAKKNNGVTVGLLPASKQEANAYIDIALPTNLGSMRNFLVVNVADVVIAIAGRWGTRNEISFAKILHKPLILIQGTGGCVDSLVQNNMVTNSPPCHIVNSGKEAMSKALEYLK
ncbi:MAG: TIGR00725 family protein [Candidatus Thermoplasmatota archaeon]|nr:TIGR00725 family protein [Candidatus Thermoplasmatota archaeon]